ncbi:hypothetical protein NQ317_004451 [Molorchus minor]|uniref:Uncharacterized protein n=1 Tax=Molorchus minor TaxID=1323400 RepID=A0ABQ9IYB0_9CUCU|nr:hypothetical protein NQ317_004451 [Molorchus minor]
MGCNTDPSWPTIGSKSGIVYSENVLLAYFSENAKNYKSSTLWAQYSMVKSCLIIYDNIDKYKQIPQTDRIFEKNR